MDVLALLKKDHDQIKVLLSSFGSASGLDDFRSLIVPLKASVGNLIKMESEFLFPEIDGLFSGSDQLVQKLLAKQGVIASAFDEFTKLLSLGAESAAKIFDLGKRLVILVTSHLLDQQDLIIPRVRKLIPTEDREDLAEVFLDTKRDLGISVAL
jgi:hypothetical protein